MNEKPRIKLTRMHQINGPDFWQANCYMLDYSFESVGLTQQKALDAIYARIDAVVFADWNYAHALNDYFDERTAKLNAQAYKEIPTPLPPKKWHWTHWFWNPQD